MLQQQVEDEWTLPHGVSERRPEGANAANLETVERTVTANPFNEVSAGTIRCLADTTRHTAGATAR